MYTLDQLALTTEEYDLVPQEARDAYVIMRICERWINDISKKTRRTHSTRLSFTRTGA